MESRGETGERAPEGMASQCHALRLLATAWTVASAPPSVGRVSQTNGTEIQLDSFNSCDTGCVQRSISFFANMNKAFSFTLYSQ